MAQRLNAGDRFPALALRLVGGRVLRAPEELDSRYTVLLFYRGHW